ncbi:MAG TPA: preprotein translocase subunit SecA [Candidatus Dojkabacteria bacterium]|nr:preprotein translocase subunit SecA [Candidatus Dojkabacteria bacterium]
MWNFISKFFDSNEKQLRKMQPLIDKVNALGEEYSKLSDEKLKKKTQEFRSRIYFDPTNNRKMFNELDKVELKKLLDNERALLDDILPEAFAVAREASKRVSNHKHFDVQVLAGYFLYNNKITELFTGEGKTLAANLPLYLYGLTGRGAHLVTVNDYLARRDAEWNGHILSFLGITVGAINNNTQYRYITDEEAIKIKGEEAKKLIKQRDAMAKKDGRLKYDHMTGVNLLECSKAETYACDVVYGTNNEFGFDYLRDNMANTVEEIVQGPLYYAIVDEADSILIDEARTPLIISTSAEVSNDMYKNFANVVTKLKKDIDYSVDEKTHSVSLNDEGIDKVEKFLKVSNVYEDSQLAYHLDNALKAKELYKNNEEYIIKDGEVLIVDEFTGRILPGRRYSEGLHQAIEAKEGVEVKRESQTMATITLQNYFRMYKYLAGMTGTALTEAEEFSKIYNLDVVVIPTNNPVIREDLPDVVFRTQQSKFQAIVDEIIEKNKTGQPVLVGTTSVEKSEAISDLLSKQGIKHNVLNAKHNELEAKIVRDAGQKGQITIATNMAGRGTDISLGKGVKELGGLYIIGSERHDSRRIDNQLRGRAGRQGDPGKSKFYISFEDELMRLFGGDQMNSIITSLGVNEDIPISLSLLGRTIESAQKKVEAHNYDQRKNLVEYDDVLNKQRDIVYDIRRKVLFLHAKYPKQLKETKFDVDKLKSFDVNRILDELETFALSDENTWKLEYTNEIYDLSNPILFWMLKKVTDHVKFVFEAQLVDDMKVDNIEERNLFLNLKSFFTDELFEICIKIMGYDTYPDFFRDFDDLETNAQKIEKILQLTIIGYIYHINAIGVEYAIEVSKLLTLQTIGNMWMEHLDTMTDLREGISLRNLAQKDPLVEYKNEGFNLFNKMMSSIDEGVVTRFFKVRAVHKEQETKTFTNQSDKQEGIKVTAAHNTKKIGRNDPCPCGSGKKYKKCHYPLYG